eukprot:5737837-Amphidinium_carterae.1
MSRVARCSLAHEEASLLLQCGSFWPNSMVDKVSFMQMLASILNVEAQPDIQIERWEGELLASCACNASGVVDVKHFVSFCLKGVVEGTETVLDILSTPQQEDERVAAPSVQSNERLASIDTKPGSPSNPSGRDARPISSLMSMTSAVFGEPTPLPSPEDQAGAVLVVDSKQYVLGERLGSGAGGS